MRAGLPSVCSPLPQSPGGSLTPRRPRGSGTCVICERPHLTRGDARVAAAGMPSPGAGRGLFEQQGPPACKLSLYLVPQTVISSARQPWSRAVSPACVGATGGGGQGHAVHLNLTPRHLEGSLQGQLRGRRGHTPETTRWDGRARGEVTQLRLPWPEHPSFHSIEPPGAGSQIPGSGVWTGPGGDARSPPRDVLRLSLWPPRMGDSSWVRSLCGVGRRPPPAGRITEGFRVGGQDRPLGVGTLQNLGLGQRRGGRWRSLRVTSASVSPARTAPSREPLRD